MFTISILFDLICIYHWSHSFMVVSVENNLFFNRKVHCPFVCVTQMPRMMFTLMMNLLQRIMPFSVLIIHLHHYLLLDRYYSLFQIAVSNFSRCLFFPFSITRIYFLWSHSYRTMTEKVSISSNSSRRPQESPFSPQNSSYT